jgi:Protein of unknown function (DUF1573).
MFNVLCLSTLTSCNESTNKKITIQRDSSLMYFIDKEFDFGVIPYGKVVSHDFTVINKGNANLLIYKVRTSCGCTVGSFDSKPIKPGGQGKITIRFDSTGKQGKIVNIVTVESNANPEMEDLKLTCEIN